VLIHDGDDSSKDGRGCGCCGTGVNFGEGGSRSFTKAAWGKVGGGEVATAEFGAGGVAGDVHDG
jgi:hypothetical protein